LTVFGGAGGPGVVLLLKFFVVLGMSLSKASNSNINCSEKYLAKKGMGKVSNLGYCTFRKFIICEDNCNIIITVKERCWTCIL
jgi:hypothetical protein